MSNHGSAAEASGDLLKLVSEIVASYVSNNPVPVSDLPAMIRSVHATLGGLTGSSAIDAVTTQKPAVPVKKSITPEFLVCLEDGKKLKMLKRYLRARYKMSPDEYRQRWNLPPDYPMVAPNYARQRSRLAKEIGLGTRARRGRG